MRFTFLRSIAIAGLLAVAASVVTRVEATGAVIVHALQVCRDWAVGALIGIVKAATQTMTGPRLMGFVKARAFVLRIAKRERPLFSASWRMCPSI